MTPEAVSVRWEVASDEGMRNIVKRGTTMARPDLGHSIHVEIDGLRPGLVVLVPVRRWWRGESGGSHPNGAGRERAA
jgi:alkaline phosphatase D